MSAPYEEEGASAGGGGALGAEGGLCTGAGGGLVRGSDAAGGIDGVEASGGCVLPSLDNNWLFVGVVS